MKDAVADSLEELETASESPLCGIHVARAPHSNAARVICVYRL